MKRLLLIALCTASLVASSAEAITRNDRSLPDGAGVTLRMSVPEASVLNPGETVSFHYQTGNDALVVIFNIDTEGYVHLLNAEDVNNTARAFQTYAVPSASGESLVVSGETGVEFVFALTIPDRSLLDESALSYLAESDRRPADQRYRISGDPFLAANIVAADLVRGISRHDGVFFDYTHFFVNQRVDFPCYLCSTCDGATGDTDCDRYAIALELDRDRPLTYPLARGYRMTEPAMAQSSPAPENVAEAEVDIDFYPYNSRIRGYSTPYVYRVYDPWYYDALYWDPWLCGWGYYPVYSGWNFAVGWGAGWYWGWGGYYCSRGYDPWCGYDSYATYSTRYPSQRFKTTFKTKDGSVSSLTAARRTSLRRDSDLQIASRDIRTSRRLATVRTQSGGRGDVTNRSGYRANTSRKGEPARIHGTRATVNRKTSGQSVRDGNHAPAAKPRASRPVRQQPAARPQSTPTRSKGGEARSDSGSRTKSPPSSSGAKAKGSDGAKKGKDAAGSKSSGNSSRSGKAKGGKR